MININIAAGVQKPEARSEVKKVPKVNNNGAGVVDMAREAKFNRTLVLGGISQSFIPKEQASEQQFSLPVQREVPHSTKNTS